MNRAETILMLQVMMVEIHEKHGLHGVGYSLARKAKHFAREAKLQPQINMLNQYLSGKYWGRLLKWGREEGGYLGLEELHNIDFWNQGLSARSHEFQKIFLKNIKTITYLFDDYKSLQ